MQGWALAAWPGIFLVFFERLQFASWPPDASAWTDRVQAALPNVGIHLVLAMALLAIITGLHRDRLAPLQFVALATLTGIVPAVLLPFAVLGGAAGFPVCAAWAAAQAAVTLAGQALVYQSTRAIQRRRPHPKHKAV